MDYVRINELVATPLAEAINQTVNNSFQAMQDNGYLSNNLSNMETIFVKDMLRRLAIETLGKYKSFTENILPICTSIISGTK